MLDLSGVRCALLASVMLGDTAVAVEDVGAAWSTLTDHRFQTEQPGEPDEPTLEACTSLGYVRRS